MGLKCIMTYFLIETASPVLTTYMQMCSKGNIDVFSLCSDCSDFMGNNKAL